MPHVAGHRPCPDVRNTCRVQQVHGGKMPKRTLAEVCHGGKNSDRIDRQNMFPTGFFPGLLLLHFFWLHILVSGQVEDGPICLEKIPWLPTQELLKWFEHTMALYMTLCAMSEMLLYNSYVGSIIDHIQSLLRFTDSTTLLGSKH